MKKIEAIKIDLPDQIKRHLIKLIKSSGLPANEETLREYTHAWEEKERMIENEIDKFNLKELDFIEQNDEREVIIMTYSGSIIRMSEPKNGVRNLEYYSIQSRDDVPQKVSIKKAQLAYDIIKDEPIDFKDCKIISTSNVYKIIVPRSGDTQINNSEEFLDDLSLMLIEHSMK